MKRTFALFLILLFCATAMAEGLDAAWNDGALSLELEAAEEAPLAVEAPLLAAANATAPKVITLKKDMTKKVYLGTTYQIEVSGKQVKSFKSSDKKVAKVSKTGLITLKKAGSAKITVKLSNKKLVLTLKVIDPTVPTKVTINEGKKGTLTVGTPYQLSAVVKPSTASQKVKWKSAKKSIATVDANGRVTPKKAGTVKITATAGKVSATFTATVKKDKRIELSQYWNKDLAATVKKLDGFKKVSGSGDYVTYSDGSVRIAEYQAGSYKSGIGYIYVENTDRYTLFGVSIGMSRSEAKALMKKYEGKGDYYEYGDWVTYSAFYPEVDSWFTLTFENGKVATMTQNEFTDY